MADRTVPVPLPPLAGFIDALDPLPDDALDDLMYRLGLGEISAEAAINEARRHVWPELDAPDDYRDLGAVTGVLVALGPCVGLLEGIG